jgi:hypothetical protein
LWNALPFAFQASIFTERLRTAFDAADRLRASAVMVNDHTAFRFRKLSEKERLPALFNNVLMRSKRARSIPSKERRYQSFWANDELTKKIPLPSRERHAMSQPRLLRILIPRCGGSNPPAPASTQLTYCF